MGWHGAAHRQRPIAWLIGVVLGRLRSHQNEHGQRTPKRALRESEEYDTDQKPERERAGNIGEW